jgi:hypothetical protein
MYVVFVYGSNVWGQVWYVDGSQKVLKGQRLEGARAFAYRVTMMENGTGAIGLAASVTTSSMDDKGLALAFASWRKLKFGKPKVLAVYIDNPFKDKAGTMRLLGLDSEKASQEYHYGGSVRCSTNSESWPQIIPQFNIQGKKSQLKLFLWTSRQTRSITEKVAYWLY